MLKKNSPKELWRTAKEELVDYSISHQFVIIPTRLGLELPSARSPHCWYHGLKEGQKTVSGNKWAKSNKSGRKQQDGIFATKDDFRSPKGVGFDQKYIVFFHQKALHNQAEREREREREREDVGRKFSGSAQSLACWGHDTGTQELWIHPFFQRPSGVRREQSQGVFLGDQFEWSFYGHAIWHDMKIATCFIWHITAY